MSKKHELNEAEYEALLVVCYETAQRANAIQMLGGSLPRDVGNALFVMQGWVRHEKELAEQGNPGE